MDSDIRPIDRYICFDNIGIDSCELQQAGGLSVAHADSQAVDHSTTLWLGKVKAKLQAAGLIPRTKYSVVTHAVTLWEL